MILLEWEYSIGAVSNRNAASLMIETNVKSYGWGWASPYWEFDLENFLAVREDEQDLDVDYSKPSRRFVRSKLQPMIEDTPCIGTVHRTKEEVRGFMTKENSEKFREEVMNEQASGAGDADDSWQLTFVGYDAG